MKKILYGAHSNVAMGLGWRAAGCVTMEHIQSAAANSENWALAEGALGMRGAFQH